VCDVIEVRDGKVYREREYYDQMTMMQQLGVVPAQ
jgi:ketosteroid isomerase-like protein